MKISILIKANEDLQYNMRNFLRETADRGCVVAMDDVWVDPTVAAQADFVRLSYIIPNGNFPADYLETSDFQAVYPDLYFWFNQNCS